MIDLLNVFFLLDLSCLVYSEDRNDGWGFECRPGSILTRFRHNSVGNWVHHSDPVEFELNPVELNHPNLVFDSDVIVEDKNQFNCLIYFRILENLVVDSDVIVKDKNQFNR